MKRTMKQVVSADKIAEFERQVEQDWPKDPMLQEIHLIRMIRQEEARAMTLKEKVRHYGNHKKGEDAA